LNALLAYSRGVDWVTERIGRTVYWLLLAAVLISTVNALLRYAFDIGSNAWLELQWYLFAAMFMLGAGYVFLHDQHVRIDVVAGRLPRRMQVWIDVIGITLFLLPLCVFVAWTSLPSIGKAIDTMEVSANPGGLIRWPLYVLVPIGFALLSAQSLSELFKRIGFLAGRAPDPHAEPEKTEEEKLLEDLQAEAEAAARGAAGAAPGGRP
jgi:TRAP-type mannitol/chloroaromatic compound transport system permease small subunit